MPDATADRKTPSPGPAANAVRLMLVADREHRRGAPADSRVRRFRLARVALDEPIREPRGRHDHLKRSYD